MNCRTITCPICGGEGGAIIESGYTQHGPGFGAATPNEEFSRCDTCLGDGEVDTCLPDEFLEAGDYDPVYIEWMLQYAELPDEKYGKRLNERQREVSEQTNPDIAANEQGQWG